MNNKESDRLTHQGIAEWAMTPLLTAPGLMEDGTRSPRKVRNLIDRHFIDGTILLKELEEHEEKGK